MTVGWDFAFFDITTDFCHYKLLLDLLEDQDDTLATLTTTVVLLNKTDGLNDINIERKRVLDNFDFRLIILIITSHQIVDQLLFLRKRHGWRLFFIFVRLLLFLLLLATLLLFLLFTGFLLYGLFEHQVELDTVVFAEVSRDRNLDNRGIVF